MPVKSTFSTPQTIIGLPSQAFLLSLCKILAVAGLVLSSVSFFIINNPTCSQGSTIVTPLRKIFVPPPREYSVDPPPPTELHHLVFGLVGSAKAWPRRRHYIESWWIENLTRGYMFLDNPPTKELLPWPSTSPPFRVSEDNSETILQYTKQNNTMVRIARSLLEVFRQGDEGVRWFVMGDDDSIFFLENWIDVLRNYDHNKYVYIGGHSESVLPNFIHSFEMGFGGAGVAFSYPLAAAIVPRLDECIKRYPQLYAADQMWQSCCADIGVYLSAQKGIHQIDLHGDISGLLSAHPPAPLLSLHHPETVDPYFPTMNRRESVNHLMKASRVDQSRLLQQTVCYNRQNGWSFSVSWGYSVHIYESIYPKSILQKPLETFKPWVIKNIVPPFFIFNTRWPVRDPCLAPHVFYFESISEGADDLIVTTYSRHRPRGLPACLGSGNHSAEYVSNIRVFSSSSKLKGENRRECCDILRLDESNLVDIKYRQCLKDEVIG
ncbi:uncharacterized protein LOC124925455 [Impatiens glandulifera]|uniref:uncharacterized protein LOC124925455 n=1 Tax=Impatiens glandulifera TaxID=253017 RepID=UPI001FB11B1C|nr:uncharacterized protein LOC124925455 [Impatiens glandulifera]XP_047321412.1 uncharacterized protein LOC124925455 [Impatiens glandulifera]